ncbi:MAG: hypothetical protein Q8R96_20170 [Bacteroidota bacterium]|nr:hypothetical protein [Bacteroidota bacterium]
MRKSLYYFFFVIVLLLNACSGKQLAPDEADRSMKILNGNIVNLLTVGSEKPEYKILSFLMNQPGAPLPFVKKKNPTQSDTTTYRFVNNCGEYHWNSSMQIFEKTKDDSIISLFLPSEKSEINNVQVDLYRFASLAYSSRPDLPTEIDAVIKIDDKKIVTIRHNAAISNNLPEKISSLIKGTDYETGMELYRTQKGKEGKLNIEIFLKTIGIEVIKIVVDSQIEYSRQGYFFKIIDFNLKLIDHHITGKINYSAVDPTSADYIDSFNSNSSIILFEGKNEVGKIVLNKTENGELLDYFIKFSNGDEILLSKYIPILNKFLNLKY